MSIFVCRIIAAIAATAAVFASAFACPAPVMHFAPAENLEQIDVGLMDAAQHEIDLAAFVLTDGESCKRLGALRIEVFRCAFIWRQKPRQNNLHEAFSISCRESKGKNTP